MIEERRIRHADIAVGMQVHAHGRWFIVTSIVNDGRNTGTVTLTGRYVRADQITSQADNQLIWVPITGLGVRARAGRPAEAWVVDDGKAQRVALRPRYRSDGRPYVDRNGNRWAAADTTEHERLRRLGDAFDAARAS